MNIKKCIFAFLLTFLTYIDTFAQMGSGIDMASGLRSSGKIYVVVLGLVVIFCGFIIYLFMIDRKITKLEKRMKDK